jgi:NADPH2:quinone reductase
MQAIEIGAYGAADELTVVDAEVPEPKPHEVRIEIEAIGINFADIMQRTGDYVGGPEPPYRPGMEAAGRIDAVGEDVDLDVGDRVVAMVNGGAYAEYVTTPAQSVFPIPGELSFQEAAAFPVQFLTAHGCLFGWGELEADEQVLIHAAAGGVGTAAVQLASNAGAEVFGTASTQEKLDLAERLGCDHPINYTETDFVEVVHEHTEDGVDLALDGVGGDVFHDSLDALDHFGRVVAYGVASGDPPAVETPRLLFENKSVIGYHLGDAFQRKPNRVLEAIPEITQGLASGELEVIIGKTFPLADAAEAHEYIENRQSRGKVLLEP